MEEIKRVSPQQIKPKLQAGELLLVCGYDDDNKFRGNNLEGAISLHEFEAKVPQLAKDQQIVFYCA